MTKETSMIILIIQRFFADLYQDVRATILSTWMFWHLKRQRSANTSDLPSARMTLMPSNPSLTWTCHVCGEERPDPCIGVLSRDRPTDLGVRVRENVRHCNDRRECAEGAKDIFFVPERAGAQDDFDILDTPRDPDNDYEEAVIIERAE